MRPILIILFLFLANIIYGQKTIQQDIIYLKNGNIIKGKIIEEKADEFIKIETLGGSIFIFKTIEITKIERDEVSKLPDNLRFRKQFRIKEKGIYHASFVGINWNPHDGGFNIEHSTGYQFNRYIGVGIGAGIKEYSTWSGQSGISIFAEARGYLMKLPTSFTYSMAVGYGFVRRSNETWANRSKEGRGGLMLKPAIGLQFPSKGRAAFIMDYGYQLQWVKYSSWSVVDYGSNGQMVLRVGVLW